MRPPTTKKELQKLIGKINFVRRFISNLSGRIEPFMGLVKIKSEDEFHWGQNSSRLSMKSRDTCRSLQCWLLLSKTGLSSCTCLWETLPSPRCWFRNMTIRRVLFSTSADACWMLRPGILRLRSFAFVCSLHAQSFVIFCSRRKQSLSASQMS